MKDMHYEVWCLSYINPDGETPRITHSAVARTLRIYLEGGYGAPDTEISKAVRRALDVFSASVCSCA